jgi:succinate dehydrogenase / fumarate reductase cytochrome b subunit
MADVNRGNRPLSPHLQIYRLPLTAKLSILHRITGIGMILGAVLLVWWFVAAVLSPAQFATVDRLLTSWIGTLVMTGSLWALAYHLCNGVRHLVWDVGRNFDLAAVQRSNLMVIAGSVVLTVLALLLIRA